LRPETQAIGSIDGYKVFLLGERPHPERRQSWPIPGGTIETAKPEAVFDARVAAFTLDSVVSLAATLTRAYWRDRAPFRQGPGATAGKRVGAEFAPSLLRRLVTRAIARRVLPDVAGSSIDPN